MLQKKETDKIASKISIITLFLLFILFGFFIYKLKDLSLDLG